MESASLAVLGIFLSGLLLLGFETVTLLSLVQSGVQTL